MCIRDSIWDKERLMTEANTDTWYSDDVATFGDRLEAARAAAGLSQDGLAQKLGVRDSTVRAWESDKMEPLSLIHI